MDIKDIAKSEIEIKSSLEYQLRQGLSSAVSEDSYDEPKGFQGPGVAYGDEPPKLKESDYLAAGCGWVYAAVSAIADAVMKVMKLRLYKTDAKGEITEVLQHNALDLIYKVNSYQTFLDFIWLVQEYLELAGEAPIFVDRGESGKGEPQNLVLLRPDKLFIKKADSTGESSEVTGYNYKLSYGKSVAIDMNELLFLKYPDPVNHYRGKGTLQAAARTVDIDEFSEEYNKRFFYNGARPDSIFTTANKLTPNQRETIKAQINALYKGTKNAHKTALLESGMDWKPMSLNAKDMEFMEQQKFSRDKILAIFRVPKSIVAITDDVNLANAKIGEYTFLKWTIKPKLERLVAQLNEFYLPMFKDTENMFFAFDDPVPADIDANVKRYDSALSKGYMTLNEVRAELNLPDAGPDGDVLLVPNSVVPLEQAGQQSTFPGIGLSFSKITSKNAGDYRKRGVIDRSVGGYYKAFRIATAVNKAKKTVKEFQGTIAKIAKDEIGKNIKARKRKEEQTKKDWEITKKEFALETRKAGDGYERYFKTTQAMIFNKQAEKVLSKMPKGKSIKTKRLDPEDYLLDEKQETQIMVRIYDPILKQIVKVEGARAARLVGKTPFDLASRPVQEYLKNRGYKFSFEVNEETNKLLGKTLADGIQNGESIPDLRKRVQTLFDDMEKYRAERIARAEVIRASNFSKQEAYTQSGVVEKKEWFAYDDDRSCEFCPKLDGKVIGLDSSYFDKGDTFRGKEGGVLNLDYGDVEYPPLHVNCRCAIVPARFV